MKGRTTDAVESRWWGAGQFPPMIGASTAWGRTETIYARGVKNPRNAQKGKIDG